MANNEQILLDNILEHRRMQIASGLKPDEFFQLFAFEQTLKHYDPSYDELQSAAL